MRTFAICAGDFVFIPEKCCRRTAEEDTVVRVSLQHSHTEPAIQSYYFRQPKRKSGKTKWPNRPLLCTSFCFSCKFCSVFVSLLHKSVCTESTGSSRSLGIVHRSLSLALSHDTKSEISKIEFLYRRIIVDLPVTCSSSQSV